MQWMIRLSALATIASCTIGRAGTAPTSGIVLSASEMKWAPQAPGLPIQIVTLWGNRNIGPFDELVKLPGGFDSGLHAHTGDYRGVLVAGTWIHVDEGGAGADRELGPGSYVLQRGRGMHIDKCKAGADCVLFLFRTEKPDIIWPPKQ